MVFAIERHGKRPSGRSTPLCHKTALAGRSNCGIAAFNTVGKRPSTPPSRTWWSVQCNPTSTTGRHGDPISLPKPKRCCTSVAPPASASPTTKGRRPTSVRRARPSLVCRWRVERDAPWRVTSNVMMMRWQPPNKPNTRLRKETPPDNKKFGLCSPQGRGSLRLISRR